MNVLRVKDTVRKLLELDPKDLGGKNIYRDDDRRLIEHVWQAEALKHFAAPTHQINLAGFLNAFGSGSFSNPESIRRSRAWLQLNHPELRGERYNERHQIEEPEAREEIRMAGEPPLVIPKPVEVEASYSPFVSREEGTRIRMKKAMQPGEDFPQSLFPND